MLVTGTQVKTAEELLLEERKKQMQELKSIRNYLGDMKTGVRVKKQEYGRERGTVVK